MIRAAVAGFKNGTGWPFGLYLRIGLLGGIVGAAGEGLQLPANATGVAVLIATMVGTAYLLARRTAPAPAKHGSDPEPKAKAAGA